MREQRIVLKNHADFTMLRGDLSDIFVLKKDGAPGWLNKAGNETEGGCLSTPGRAEQREEFPLLNFKI